ncbi:MAG: hypothetical protein ING19_20855 [Azospirillum sp.]|nr:hypothetical protein [Azospirillum sp.]MCA3268502.1 hypothetical protein [Azospirillum sp.]
MPVSYPLTLPPPGPASVEFGPRSVVAVVESPFTLTQETQEFPGQAWMARVVVGPVTGNAWLAPWRAFFTGLNGKQGTFLLGDPIGIAPRGVATGTPLIDGTQAAGSKTLATKGWTASVSNILRAGDYLQIGSGATTRLYMLTTDANSDGTGRATLDIWPSLRREGAINNAALVTASPRGTFRLASNVNLWRLEAPFRGSFSFDAIEAL